jgi:hypothetical protein
MKIKEDGLLQKFLQLRSLYKRLQQVSWTVTSTEKRFPPFEEMNNEQLEEVLRIYLAMTFDIEDVAKEMNKLYKQYQNDKK